MYLRAHLCTQVPLGAARVEVVHAKLKWRQIKWGATVSGRQSPPPGRPLLCHPVHANAITSPGSPFIHGKARGIRLAV